MGKKAKASEIAKFLNSRLIGDDIEITGICSVDRLEDKKITFIKKLSFLKKNKTLENLNAKALLLINENRKIDSGSSNSYIKVPDPRLAFARVIDRFFSEKKKAGISPSAKIGNSVTIGEGATIGENCIIEDNTAIGKNVIMGHNVVIAKNTVIGRNCCIKSGAIIGEDGFGFPIGEDKIPIRMQHLGNVVIRNNVEIGSLSTINRGTINSTIIHDNVKINDQVHVAHNCIIGKNTVITGMVNISGAAKIGENCWLGPNCSIINKVKIGNNVKIGMGAVITKDIKDNETVMGLESLPLKSLLKLKKRIGYQ